MGVPTIIIVTDQFDNLARIEAKALKMESLRFVVIPHPLGGLEEEKVYTLEDLYRRTPKKKERYHLSYKNIGIADAHNYIGATVKVTRKNVQEKEYRLAGVTNNSLKFAQSNRHGTFSFAFQKRDIERIRVLIKEPY